MRLIDADKLANSLENNLQSFEKLISKYGKGLVHGTRIALNRIAEQPTISPESLRPQWIPVTEKLPENEGDFIVTANDSITGLFVFKDYCYKRTDGKMQFLNQIDGNLYHNHDGELKRHTRNITAWMPLPEPYTAKVEENEGVQPAHWEKADIPLPYQMRTVPTPSGTFAHREMYVCSACDGYNDRNTQYYPNCGAKMDKEVNDDD